MANGLNKRNILLGFLVDFIYLADLEPVLIKCNFNLLILVLKVDYALEQVKLLLLYLLIFILQVLQLLNKLSDVP